MHLRAPPTWNLYLSGAKGTVASYLCYIALLWCPKLFFFLAPNTWSYRPNKK